MQALWSVSCSWIWLKQEWRRLPTFWCWLDNWEASHGCNLFPEFLWQSRCPVGRPVGRGGEVTGCSDAVVFRTDGVHPISLTASSRPRTF